MYEPMANLCESVYNSRDLFGILLPHKIMEPICVCCAIDEAGRVQIGMMRVSLLRFAYIYIYIYIYIFMK